MRITEGELRRIIRDIIIEEENLNEGVLDFFMGSEEYRYVKKLSESIVDMIVNNDVDSYGIEFKDVNLNIAREGGPYVSGSLVLVDIGGNKEYLYEVESHVAYENSIPMMNVFFKGEDGDYTIFTSGTGKYSKKFSADFCVSTKVVFEDIRKDSLRFFHRLSSIFFERKSQADRERSEEARLEREERKAKRRREMGM
jgi:hypothetical protein